MSNTYLHVSKTLVETNGKGFVRFSLAQANTPQKLQPNQVLVQIQAAPINPSDIGPIFTPSHGGIGKFEDALQSKDVLGNPVTQLPIPGRYPQHLVGKSMRLGNEGAGRVVAAGKSPAAQALMGKLVACMGMGGAYSQFAIVKVDQTMVHHDTTTAEEAASSFVNPLTALGMVKTMRHEKHTGIVHTAAASQLGQMLVKICNADAVPLVCVVRRQEQLDLLQSIGAKHVVISTSPTFQQDLVAALVETNATICFDALGGGDLGFQIIKGMESAANKKGAKQNNYGSSTFKKLYIYGGLNAGQPLILRPHAGMGGFSWGVQGFLLGSGVAAISESDKKRVANEVQTTFSTTYSQRLTLEEMLDPRRMKEYQAQKSNQKSLVVPNHASVSKL